MAQIVFIRKNGTWCAYYNGTPITTSTPTRTLRALIEELEQ